MYFVLSKILWLIILPFNIICLVFLLGFLLLFKKPRAGRVLICSGLILIFVLGVDFIPDSMMGLLENRISAGRIPDRVDGIIVLVGMVDMESSRDGLVELTAQADRIITAIILARKYTGAKLIITGSSGHLQEKEEFIEADYLKKLSLSLGIDEDRLIIERNSRNTHEHAVAMSKLLSDKGQWVLITSAFHMPRSLGCFRKEGLNVIPYPVDYKTKVNNPTNISLFTLVPKIGNIGRFSVAIHEWLGLIVYRLRGYTNKVFPTEYEERHSYSDKIIKYSIMNVT